MSIVKFENLFRRDGFLQAFSLTLYCLLVGLIFWKGDLWIGNASYLGPVLVLILFVVSALVCALLVFYRPYNIFLDGNKKEAVNLVLSTAVWLMIIFLIAFLSTAVIW